MTVYGNTWWGKQWLSALKGIDYHNRLARGRSYANNGRVLDIVLQGSQIKASVAGSSVEPYNQHIMLRPFEERIKKRIVQGIKAQPMLLSKLLSREMPRTLSKMLEVGDIQLFPESWDELTANCSCPDAAVPCKHLAAVIYQLATEIDQNPFILFRLRGLDLIEGLEEVQSSIKPPDTANGETQAKNPQSLIEEPLNYSRRDVLPIQPSFDWSQLENIHFSVIPDSRDRIFRLLEPNPPFYPHRDFRSLLRSNYNRFERGATRMAKSKGEEGLQSLRIEELRIYCNANLELIQIDFLEGSTLRQRIKQMDELLEKVTALQYSDLTKSSNGLIALYLIHHFCLKLLQTGAILPRVIKLQASDEEGQYSIRWMPARIIEPVRELFQQILQLCPPQLLALRHENETLHFSPADQLRYICALFLQEMIGQFGQSRPQGVEPAFIYGDSINTNNYEQREAPESIAQWLHQFYLAERKHQPILKVEEYKQGYFALSLWISLDETEELLSLEELLGNPAYESQRWQLLQDFGLLSRQVPQLANLLRHPDKERVLLSSEEFTPLLLETLPALEMLGIRTLLPKALHRIVKPQLSMKLSGTGQFKGSQSFMDLGELLDFDWQMAIGDKMVGVEEFFKMTERMRGLVKIYDEYVLIDNKELSTLAQKLSKTPKIKGAERLKIALSRNYKGAKVELDRKAEVLMNRLSTTEDVPPPKGLDAKLRPYQVKGFQWLVKNAQFGFGSLLADDMGLGKTIQVIALLQEMKNKGQLEKQKALVVVPTTLLSNWSKELEKFAPGLSSEIYHGPKRILDLSLDITITTYGIVRSDLKKLQEIDWAILVIDEAQNIKNITTAQTRAVKRMQSKCRVAMSGTPVENRLSEYWSIFDFINKGYLGGLNKFTDAYIKPIEQDRDEETLVQFRKITAPFVLRRVKTDKSIIDDLPEKIEVDQFCSLSKEQSALYKNVVDLHLQRIESVQEGIERRGLVFKLMTALKQICNHPVHFLRKGKMKPSLSGKTQRLLELLEEIYDNGEKVLIFTQYKVMGDLLQDLLSERYNQKVLFLHGGLSRKQRDDMVTDFQEKNYIQTMILSLKAGGTGLNLTAANHVIHYDLWWNPAVEAQATDRAFRIGQQKNVMVSRLITKGTFEEKINAMLEHKKELANMAISLGEKWIGELSDNELKGLFDLED